MIPLDALPMDWAWRLAGWTMIHFVWVGAALALFTLAVRLVLRRASPHLRYVVTLGAFAAITLAPLAIAAWLVNSDTLSVAERPPAPVIPERAAPVAVAPVLPVTDFAQIESTPHEPLPPQTEEPAGSIIDLAVTPIVVDPPQYELSEVPAAESVPAVPIEPSVAAPAAAAPVAAGPQSFDFVALLDRLSLYLPWVWLVGAPLTFLLLATGLLGVEQLRKGSQVLTEGPVYDACERLRSGLRIGRRVVVAVSHKVAQPVLVGIVRPLILLPEGAIAGWSAAQIEMALLHELAHVRRWDNLVNLVQRVVESVLFFHPAVWMVSHQLRTDREQCCDAVVVAHTGEPTAYAELLLAVANTLPRRRLPVVASAMAQHPLTRRIRRVLQLEEDPMLVSRTTVAGSVATLVVVALVACNYPSFAGDGKEQDKAAVAQESTDAQEEAKEGASDKQESEEQAKPANPHFMTLEDQRVADLAYGMFQMEVEPLDEKWLPLVKEAGFSGGVKVTEAGGSTYILTGIHVWPVENIESLGQVLRKSDLVEFNPVKLFTLHQHFTVTVPSAPGYLTFHDDPSDVEFRLRTFRKNFERGAWWAEQERVESLKAATGGKGDSWQPPSTNEKAQAKLMRRLMQLPPHEALHPTPPRTADGDEAAPGAGGEAGEDMKANIHLGNPAQAPAKAQLRYNDKSFDEWRTLWRTELNPEKRIEAIHAMTAFGRAGYGKEAVEAILDVAEEYATTKDTTKTAEGRLLQAIIASLTGYRGEINPISAHVVLPFLKEKYEAQPEKYERLFSKVVSSLNTNDPAVLKQVRALCEHDNATIRRAAVEMLVQRDRLTQRPETVEAIRLALADREPMNINRAITLLQDIFRRMDVSSHLKQQQFPELIPLLFHETDSVRQNARGALLFLESTSRTRVAELLVTVVERPGESHEFDGLQLFEPAKTEQAQHKVRITALRALAVSAPPSESAYNSAAELLLNSEDDAVKIAAYVAMERIYVVGLNRARNKAFEDALRENLQEVFESPTELRESTNAELEELVAPRLHTWLFNQGVRPRREN